jgi:hypothetical protein
MKNKAVKWFGWLLFFTSLIISCAGTETELSQKQVSGAYNGPPVSNILVIAITGNEHNRRSYENKFVTRLNSVGVEAVASEELIPMPPDLKLQKETILKAVGQYGNDAVIITQLVGKEKKDVYARSGAGRRSFFTYQVDPGYSSTTTKIRLETNLYDAKNGELIWSGQSNTLSQESFDKIMNDVIRAVIDNWRKNKIIVAK